MKESYVWFRTPVYHDSSLIEVECKKSFLSYGQVPHIVFGVQNHIVTSVELIALFCFDVKTECVGQQAREDIFDYMLGIARSASSFTESASWP